MNQAVLIDGKATAQNLRVGIKADAATLAAAGTVPGLAVIMVGDNAASAVYVRNKHRSCGECGIYSEVLALPAQTTEAELLHCIRELNERTDIHGILVQLPLPAHLCERTVLNAIDPTKDVDGFHPINAGHLLLGEPGFVPCTPAGVMALLDAYGIDPAGKECAVVGRSNIVGKPQALLLLQRNATVTVCHSRTVDLPQVLRRADLLVVAVGKPGFITADCIKPGAVVIDVGINRLPDGHLCGDCAFDEVAARASYITPVPGGVGPMTITMLLRNTVTAAARACGVTL